MGPLIHNQATMITSLKIWLNSSEHFAIQFVCVCNVYVQYLWCLDIVFCLTEKTRKESVVRIWERVFSVKYCDYPTRVSLSYQTEKRGEGEILNVFVACFMLSIQFVMRKVWRLFVLTIWNWHVLFAKLLADNFTKQVELFLGHYNLWYQPKFPNTGTSVPYPLRKGSQFERLEQYVIDRPSFIPDREIGFSKGDL